MKTKADRELKGISQKAFNKTNHIIKIISCLFLSMFILCQPLSFCVPVNAETIDDDIVMTDNTSNDSTKQETKKSDTQTNECKVIRVGSFEDTFNYVDENGVRRGFGYELMQALAGYAGWKFEYVKCDWSNCFDKLENGEIDVIGDISYTDERTQEMLFSEEPMGEEKYILYADMSNTDMKYFNENEVHTVAVPKEKEALKQHIAFNYPQWKLVDYDSFNDAEDMVIKEAEAILERVGLKIERVEDGVQCVNKVAKMPVGTYDMILMDIQMPKMDGYKATQEIRHLPDKDKACIPIIAMTASAFEEDKGEAIAAGMNGHIAKPIDVNELMAILVENIR